MLIPHYGFPVRLVGAAIIRVWVFCAGVWVRNDEGKWLDKCNWSLILPNSHERSVASALKTVAALGKLSDRLRGRNSAIHQAYRTVLRALKGNTDNVQIVVDALATLEASIRAAATNYYEVAIGVGTNQAVRDLQIYNLGEPDDPDPNSIPVAITSTIGLLKYQSDRAVAIAQMDIGDELIIGDATRRGIIQPAPVLGEMAFWLTSLSVVAHEAGTKRQMPEVVRQAVAQIDQHTTPCCLAVHGQIVKEEEDFHLTAPPKYASRMHSSPFHRGCRTGIAVILPKFIDDDVTARMRQDAIEQGKKPKPSTMVGRAHYRVVGKSVQEFRKGRWHTYKRHDTNLAARSAAARLNEARRS